MIGTESCKQEIECGYDDGAARWVYDLNMYDLCSGPLQTIEITTPFEVEPFQVLGRSTFDKVSYY